MRTDAPFAEKRASEVKRQLMALAVGLILVIGLVRVSAADGAVTGIPLTLVDVDYDAFNQGIVPCWSLPAGVYTATAFGEAGFKLATTVHYLSGGVEVTLSGTEFLDKLAVASQERNSITLEFFLPGPEPDDLTAIAVQAGLVAPEIIVGGGDPKL